MKHIFTVHSPLTFLAAYATIKHLRLCTEEVVLISSNYRVLIDTYPVYPSYAERNRGFWNKLKTWNVPLNYDNYIQEITKGESYTAYIDLMSYYQRILVTHKDCKEFHFIEEGNSTFQEFDDLTDITWHERTLGFRTKGFDKKSITRVLRGFNLRLIGMPYIYSAYSNMKGIRFYAFSQNAFFNVPSSKRVLLSLEKEDSNMLKMAGNFSLENEVVWLDGSNSRYTGLSEEIYFQAIERAIPILREKGILHKKVYAKLRPGIEDYKEVPLIRILQKHGLDVEVMPDQMVFESFLICSRNCDIVGNLTSALEYAHVFGHKAYSIYGLFEQRPSTFFDRMTGFWENIEMLEG